MFNTQRPTYEDFQPPIETKETPESHLLLIRLPAGFAREHIGAKFESLNRRVQIYGERPIGNKRWQRFSVVYPVPEICDAKKLNRKFQAGIVTVTMPKKVISRIGPKEELKLPTQQAAPKPPLAATVSKPEKAQEVIPPKLPTRVEEGKAISAEVKAPKGQEGISQEAAKSTFGSSQRQADERKVEAAIPPKATGESMTQKGQEGFHKKSSLPMDKKNQTDEKLPGSVSEIGEKQRVEKKETKEDIGKTSEVGNPPEKSQEVIPLRRRVEEGKATTAQEGFHKKSALTMDKKVQTDEKLPGSVSENGEKQRVEKKETKEDIGKTPEGGNPTEEKAVVDGSFAEKESKTERKESAVVAESTAPKTTNKEKEKNGKFGNLDEGGKGIMGIIESKGKGIKEVAASASQAVTRMAKRFNEEDKQKIIYMGAAAVLVIAALGICASNKIRSLGRP